MRGKPHDPEIKAAVMAALLAGQGVSEIAKEFGLDEATVRNWKRKLPEFNEVNGKNAVDFDQLLCDYLQENLITLAAQSRFFRDFDWLKKQSASDLAVLHGVAADKAIRILAAFERGNTSDSTDASSDE